MIHDVRLRPNGSPTLFERPRSPGAPQTLAEFEAILAKLLTRARGAKDVHGSARRTNSRTWSTSRRARRSTPISPSRYRRRSASSWKRRESIGSTSTRRAPSSTPVRGKHVAVATGTASGKSLAYHLPILERLLLDREAIALYLFPTKALAQDQLRGLERIRDLSPALRPRLLAGTYDGDTPTSARRRLREEANAILTNPDMLHQGILPYHSRWSRVFSNLRYVVVDEMHTYRGIFGSHVANVLRRLRRVARHYGADPQFLLSSATICNTGEQAALLVGTK